MLFAKRMASLPAQIRPGPVAASSEWPMWKDQTILLLGPGQERGSRFPRPSVRLPASTTT